MVREGVGSLSSMFLSKGKPAGNQASPMLRGEGEAKAYLVRQESGCYSDYLSYVECINSTRDFVAAYI